jgi:hypothetical protein
MVMADTSRDEFAQCQFALGMLRQLDEAVTFV